jgi:hypothetical protein
MKYFLAIFFNLSFCIVNSQDLIITPKSYKIERVFDYEDKSIIKNDLTIDFKLENLTENFLVKLDSIKCYDEKGRSFDNIFYQKSPFNLDDNFGYFTVSELSNSSNEITIEGLFNIISKKSSSNKQIIPYKSNFLNRQVIENNNDYLKLFIIDLNDLQYYFSKDKTKYQKKINEIAENYIFKYSQTNLDIETIKYFFENEIQNQDDIYISVKDDNSLIAEINVIDSKNKKINTGFYSDIGITKHFNNVKLRMPRPILDTDKIEIIFYDKEMFKSNKFKITNIKL